MYSICITIYNLRYLAESSFTILIASVCNFTAILSIHDIIRKYLCIETFLLAISNNKNNPKSMASSALNIIITAADAQINIT